MIDRFADATADYQNIHVDPVRAAGTPFGGTVAHGMLTLSLLPAFSASLARPRIDGVRMRINYGFDRARFVQPGLRMAATIAGILEKRPGRFQQVMDVTIEAEGEDIPALTDFLVDGELVGHLERLPGVASVALRTSETRLQLVGRGDLFVRHPGLVPA